MESLLSHLPQSVSTSSLAATGTSTMAAAASAASAAAARIGAVLSDAQYFESSMVRPEDIRRQLDSRSLKDKLDAMKRVVALISLGRDASMFFPDVVKNVVAPSLDIKKLVYLYLVHYAEDKQDLALLSVNSFQKDLSDPNQVIRALALRVLSSIRVRVILQIVIHAITKCASDPSPYVRKTAAHAICKVCSLDASSRENLLEPLALLLNDRSFDVLGSAVAVLQEVAPDEFHLIHPHFRYLCRSLPFIDPHGQVAVLRCLLRYGRTQFSEFGSTLQSSKRDPDLVLLLDSARPLCMSRNTSVVCAVIALFFHLGTVDELCATITQPLLRLVCSGEQSVQFVGLKMASDLVLRAPGALLPYLSDFFVSGADGKPIRDLKLMILTRLCETAGYPTGLGSNSQAKQSLISEFRVYLGHTDNFLAAAATRALGCLASACPSSTSAVIAMLASVVAKSRNGVVLSESVTVLRRLLQLHPHSQFRALPKLVSLLLVSRSDESSIEAPQARAAIIWLIGEFYEKAPHVAPEALRILARDFYDEAAEVKLQILNLSAKVLAWKVIERKSPQETHPVPLETRCKLFEYVTSAALLDKDFDVRDKARLLRQLFIFKVMDSKKILAICEALFEGAKVLSSGATGISLGQGGHQKSLLGLELDSTNFVVASMSHVIGHELIDCRKLPPWSVTTTNTSLRDENSEQTRSGGGVVDCSGVSSSNFSALSIGDSLYPQSSSAGLPSLTSQNGAQSFVGGGLLQNTVSMSAVRPSMISTDRFYGSEPEEGTSGGSYETESEDEAGKAESCAANVVSIPASHGEIKPSADSYGSELQLADLLLEDLSNTNAKSVPPLQVLAESSRIPRLNKGFGLDMIDVRHPEAGRTWQRVLDSWNADGIEVQVSFIPWSSDTIPDASPLLLKLTNCGKQAVAEVSVKPKNHRLVIQTLDTEFSLSPRESKQLKSCCMFGGKTTAVSFGIWIGGRSVGEGEIRPNAGHVIRPLPSLSYSEFESLEKTLGGMFGSSCKLTVPRPTTAVTPGGSLVDAVAQKCRSVILSQAFLAEIGGGLASFSTSNISRTILRFAGYLPDPSEIGTVQKCHVLVRVGLDPITDRITDTAQGAGSWPGELWIGCENVIFANTLLQVLKRALSDSNSTPLQFKDVL